MFNFLEGLYCIVYHYTRIVNCSVATQVMIHSPNYYIRLLDQYSICAMLFKILDIKLQQFFGVSEFFRFLPYTCTCLIFQFQIPNSCITEFWPNHTRDSNRLNGSQLNADSLIFPRCNFCCLYLKWEVITIWPLDISGIDWNFALLFQCPAQNWKSIDH